MKKYNVNDTSNSIVKIIIQENERTDELSNIEVRKKLKELIVSVITINNDINKHNNYINNIYTIGKKMKKDEKEVSTNKVIIIIFVVIASLFIYSNYAKNKHIDIIDEKTVNESIISDLDKDDLVEVLTDLEQIQKNGKYIINVKEPTEEMQIISVMDSAFNIKNIENPTNKVKNIALMNSNDSLEIIEHILTLNELDNKRCITKENAKNNKIEGNDVENYKKDIDLVNLNGKNIKNVKEQTEELQLIAVNQLAYNIKYIESPTDKVKRIALMKTNSLVLMKYIRALNYTEQNECLLSNNKKSKK